MCHKSSWICSHCDRKAQIFGGIFVALKSRTRLCETRSCTLKIAMSAQRRHQSLTGQRLSPQLLAPNRSAVWSIEISLSFAGGSLSIWGCGWYAEGVARSLAFGRAAGASAVPVGDPI